MAYLADCQAKLCRAQGIGVEEPPDPPDGQWVIEAADALYPDQGPTLTADEALQGHMKTFNR